MKNYLIKSIITQTLVLMVLPMWSQDFLNVYFKDGSFRIFHFDNVKSLSISKFDADGVQHSDYDFQHITTLDDDFIYPLSDIDNITFTKYNEEESEGNYNETMKSLIPELSDCNSIIDVEQKIETLNACSGVEKAWTEGDFLYVKVKNWITISFNFNNHEILTGNTIANARQMKSKVMGSQVPNKAEKKVQKTAVIAHQQLEDLGNYYTSLRTNYLVPLKTHLEDLGIQTDYIKPQLDFFYKDMYTYDYVLLTTHGSWWKNGSLHRHAFLSGQELGSYPEDDITGQLVTRVVAKSDYEKIFNDSKYMRCKDDLGLTFQREIRVGNDGVKKKHWVAYVIIHDTFFKYKAASKFAKQNSIMFNGACMSLKGDNGLANIFMDNRNLGYYLGYTESNAYGPYTGSTFYDYLLCGHSAEKAYDNLEMIKFNNEWNDDNTECLSGNAINEEHDVYDEKGNIINHFTAELKILKNEKIPSEKVFLFPTYTKQVNQEEVDKDWSRNSMVMIQGTTTTSDPEYITMGFEYGENENNLTEREEAKTNFSTIDYGYGNYSFATTLENLLPGRTYYYRAYAYDGINNNYGEICSFKIEESTTPSYTKCPDDHHPHMIDLGLPSGTKWACCNVGASKPEDKGGHYAWGETSVKDSYDSDNYLDGKGTSFDIGTDIAGTCYDTATANWGSLWVMPSYAQIEELIENCTLEKIVQNGVKGMNFTSPNGASIFLPRIGYYSGNRQFGDDGYYWSSSLYSKESASYLGDYRLQRMNRSKGLSVRPVGNMEIIPAYPDLHVSQTQLSVVQGNSYQVEITSGSSKYSVTSPHSSIAKATLQGTTVTIHAVAEGDAKVVVTDMRSSQEIIIEITVTAGDIVAYTSCPDSHHPHLIDLGLPSGTKWACCNVGASKPEDYGGYYAWGETTEKDDYGWWTYIHYSNAYLDIGKDIAGTQYDAAVANWGSPWVMPNQDQIKELINSCYNEWVTENGVNGRRFTGSNGASIFLPAAGSAVDTYSPSPDGNGCYWSSTLDESWTADARYLHFETIYNVMYGSKSREYGLSVRPVKSDAAPVYPDLRLSQTQTSIDKGNSTTVEITSGSGEYEYNLSNDGIVSVSISGSTITLNALHAGQTTVTIVDTKSSKTATIDVTVTGGGDIPSYTSCPDNHHPHLIDLGLPSGTKWACCNVGAQKPEDYGGYYAWGEATEKSRYYWDTYIHCDGSSSTCHDIGNDIAGTLYDAATANWGSPWVMPSKEQMDEIVNNCTSEWTTENGVNGSRFTGPNGASIFLPAAGYHWKDDFNYKGSYGYYWSSTLHESHSDDVWYLDFGSGYVFAYHYGSRDGGQSVRPVRKN